jgi:hypothetical protein
LSNDYNHFIDDGNGKQVANFVSIKKTCPNNCSNHGECNSYGVCDCDDGFTLVDCSLKLSDPPKIIGISTRFDTVDNSESNFQDLILYMSNFANDYSSSKVKVAIFVSLIKIIAALTKLNLL